MWGRKKDLEANGGAGGGGASFSAPVPPPEAAACPPSSAAPSPPPLPIGCNGAAAPSGPSPLLCVVVGGSGMSSNGFRVPRWAMNRGRPTEGLVRTYVVEDAEEGGGSAGPLTAILLPLPLPLLPLDTGCWYAATSWGGVLWE